MLIGTPLILNSVLQPPLILKVEWNDLPEAVGSQLVAALIVGLLLAFGLQLLLTNLGVAIGITAFRFRSSQSPTQPLQGDSQPLQQSSQSSNHASIHSNSSRSSLGVMAGLGILATVNAVLFAACFLAVRFSQVHDVISGAVLGTVIWAAYCLVLLWLSTTAATSLFSAALGFTISGISGLITLIRGVLTQKKDAAKLDEATIAAIRQQVQLSLDTINLQQLENDSAKAPPQLDWEKVRADLKQLLQRPDIQSLSAEWRNVDRSTLSKLLQHRLNLPDTELNQLVDEIEQAWHHFNPLLLNVQSYLLNQTFEQLQSEGLPDQFRALLESLEADHPSVRSQLEQIQSQDFAAILQQRNDLTDDQIQSLAQQLNAMVQIILKAPHPDSVQTEVAIAELQGQLKSYLLHTASKRLTAKRIERKLHKLLQSLQTLEQPISNLPELDLDTFQAVLQRRKNLTDKQQRQILRQIEQTWHDASHSVAAGVTDSDSDASSEGSVTLAKRWATAETVQVRPSSPEQLSDPSEQPNADAIEALLVSLASYFSPLSKLPNATDRLKQYLKDWLIDLSNDPSFTESIQSIWEQISAEKWDESLERFYSARLQPWRERLQALAEEFLPSLAEAPTHVSETAQTYLQAQIEAVKQQALEPIETLQQRLRAQTDSLKQQAQQRLEITRRRAATAAWWLFTIVLTAALSSATAGALATGSGFL